MDPTQTHYIGLVVSENMEFRIWSRDFDSELILKHKKDENQPLHVGDWLDFTIENGARIVTNYSRRQLPVLETKYDEKKKRLMLKTPLEFTQNDEDAAISAHLGRVGKFKESIVAEHGVLHEAWVARLDASKPRHAKYIAAYGVQWAIVKDTIVRIDSPTAKNNEMEKSSCRRAVIAGESHNNSYAWCLETQDAFFVPCSVSRGLKMADWIEFNDSDIRQNEGKKLPAILEWRIIAAVFPTAVIRQTIKVQISTKFSVPITTASALILHDSRFGQIKLNDPTIVPNFLDQPVECWLLKIKPEQLDDVQWAILGQPKLVTAAVADIQQRPLIDQDRNMTTRLKKAALLTLEDRVETVDYGSKKTVAGSSCQRAVIITIDFDSTYAWSLDTHEHFCLPNSVSRGLKPGVWIEFDVANTSKRNDKELTAIWHWRIIADVFRTELDGPTVKLQISTKFSPPKTGSQLLFDARFGSIRVDHQSVRLNFYDREVTCWIRKVKAEEKNDPVWVLCKQPTETIGVEELKTVLIVYAESNEKFAWHPKDGMIRLPGHLARNYETGDWIQCTMKSVNGATGNFRFSAVQCRKIMESPLQTIRACGTVSVKVPILLPFDLCGHDRIVAIDSPDLDTVIQMQLADIPSDCMGKKREIWAHFHKMAAIHWQFDGFANEEQMEINGKKRTDDDKINEKNFVPRDRSRIKQLSEDSHTSVDSGYESRNLALSADIKTNLTGIVTFINENVAYVWTAEANACPILDKRLFPSVPIATWVSFDAIRHCGSDEYKATNVQVIPEHEIPFPSRIRDGWAEIKIPISGIKTRKTAGFLCYWSEIVGWVVDCRKAMPIGESFDSRQVWITRETKLKDKLRVECDWRVSIWWDSDMRKSDSFQFPTELKASCWKKNLLEYHSATVSDTSVAKTMLSSSSRSSPIPSMYYPPRTLKNRRQLSANDCLQRLLDNRLIIDGIRSVNGQLFADLCEYAAQKSC